MAGSGDGVTRRRALGVLALGAVGGAVGAVAQFLQSGDDGSLVSVANAPTPTPTPTPTSEVTVTPAPSVLDPESEQPLDEPTAEPTPTPEPEPEPEPPATADEGGTGEDDPKAGGVLQVIGREGWGAVAATGAFRDHVPERLTLHHTAVVLGDNTKAPARLRQHQRFHQSNDWPDIAYHFAVDRNGNAYELRPPGAAGDTFTSYDPTGHFLVVCEGDFSKETPTPAQVDTAARLFAWAADTYGIDPGTVNGHDDYAATSCPGGALSALVDDRSIEDAVRRHQAVGVQLDVLTGQAARDRGAAVEAGLA